YSDKQFYIDINLDFALQNSQKNDFLTTCNFTFNEIQSPNCLYQNYDDYQIFVAGTGPERTTTIQINYRKKNTNQTYTKYIDIKVMKLVDYLITNQFLVINTNINNKNIIFPIALMCS